MEIEITWNEREKKDNINRLEFNGDGRPFCLTLLCHARWLVDWRVWAYFSEKKERMIDKFEIWRKELRQNKDIEEAKVIKTEEKNEVGSEEKKIRSIYIYI